MSACCTRSSAALTRNGACVVNTIGPVWDGNEVWLIVAGAVIFAAFPGWYATMFSTFYLALVVLLLALMVRGVAFEYQRKFDDPRWRSAVAVGAHDRERAHPSPRSEWHWVTCCTACPSTRPTNSPGASGRS